MPVALPGGPLISVLTQSRRGPALVLTLSLPEEHDGQSAPVVFLRVPVEQWRRE